MPKKCFTPEQIIGKLQHADVLLAQGVSRPAVGQELLAPAASL